jgi:hypothetical protein
MLSNSQEELSYFRSNTKKFQPPLKESIILPFSNEFMNQMNQAMSINIEDEIMETNESYINKSNNKNIQINDNDDNFSCFRLNTEKFKPPIEEGNEKINNNNFIEKMDEAMMTLNIDDSLFDNNEYDNNDDFLLNKKVYNIKFNLKEKNIVLNLNLSFNNNNINN